MLFCILNTITTMIFNAYCESMLKHYRHFGVKSKVCVCVSCVCVSVCACATTMATVCSLYPYLLLQITKLH